MTLAYTSAFFPNDLDQLHQAIRDQALTEDLGVRAASVPDQVIVYALEGASSWPYECTLNGEQVDFDIIEFVAGVAGRDQDIELHENGQTTPLSLGAPARPAQQDTRGLTADRAGGLRL